MRVELQELHKKLGTTMIYVTHDQTEAMTLGTRIVVMKEGRIQQADTPEMIYDNPANLFVAGFIGSPSMNFLEGLIRREGSRTVFETEGARLTIPGSRGERLGSEYENRKIVLGIRPEDLFVPGKGDKGRRAVKKTAW